MNEKDIDNELSEEIEEVQNDENTITIPYSISGVLRKIFIAWIFAAIVMYMQVPRGVSMLGDLEAYNYISGGIGFITGLMIFLLLMLYPLFMDEHIYLERGMLFVGFVMLGTASLMKSFSASFLGAVLVAAFLMLIYTDFGWNDGNSTMESRVKAHRNIAPKVAIMIGISFFMIVAAWTVARVKSHSTPTYDFGIFAQMFYSMKTHGTMVTTLERQETMSHLCVHVSFIYYLMLPFYFLYSRPEMLQILQAAVLASAFYPLWKLARYKRMTRWEATALVALLALYPAYGGGTSYDLHENVFLTPLILWLFYAIERKNKLGIIIAGILTLLVKEDAAIYIIVIALYLLVKAALSKDDRKWLLVTGASMMIVAFAYFSATTTFLTVYGDGVMTSRYKNFIYDESGSLVTVIKAILMQPMKVLYEITEPEKIPYIGMTLGALLGLPLITRKYERFILLIPYVLVNLLSDYDYQSSVYFQYGYGPTAFLFFLFVLNYTDIKGILPKKYRKYRKYLLIVPICICSILFYNTVVKKAMTYMERYQEHYATYVAREEMMDKIPEDASVAATTYFTVYLSSRDEIYDIKHAIKDKVFNCDYIFADYGETACFERFKTEDNPDGYSAFKEQLFECGYVISPISGFGIDIYVKQ